MEIDPISIGRGIWHAKMQVALGKHSLKDRRPAQCDDAGDFVDLISIAQKSPEGSLRTQSTSAPDSVR
jgi:hypothetical protein